MCFDYIHECLCTQKRASDLLKLELQMIVNGHVDAGNRTQIFCKSSQCS